MRDCDDKLKKSEQELQVSMRPSIYYFLTSYLSRQFELTVYFYTLPLSKPFSLDINLVRSGNRSAEFFLSMTCSIIKIGFS